MSDLELATVVIIAPNSHSLVTRASDDQLFTDANIQASDLLVVELAVDIVEPWSFILIAQKPKSANTHDLVALSGEEQVVFSA
jgi:hypothetical protein